MKKTTLLFSLIFFTLLSNANAAEQWQCALDLQQGDKGSMTLERSNASVTGSINIDRNGSEFSQEIEGRWLDREVEFKRFLNSTSNEEMHGVAIRVGTSQVKMGGRFAEGLNGVWSADCDLVSAELIKASDTAKKPPSEIEPSISARTTPTKPVSGDKVSFAAQAFHTDGIESITFYLNDKSVHQCQSAECSVSHGPLKAGEYQWHVIAKSKNGIENTKRSNELVIDGSASVGSCVISGIATGSAVAKTAGVTIELIRSNSSKGAIKTTTFNAGAYHFDGVQTGSYLLSVDVADSLGILVSPETQQVNCDVAATVQQNFQFN